MAARRLLAGRSVAALGFGGYRVSNTPQHAAALLTSLEHGCDVIDTSPSYTDGGSESAKQQTRFQPLDRVVCRLERRKWASGVVQSVEDNLADDGEPMLACVHVMIDAPTGGRGLVAVPESACHLQRRASCSGFDV